MRFAITKTISSQISEKFIYQNHSSDVRLADYLNSQISLGYYGDAVSVLYAGLNCVNHGVRAAAKDFETGFVIHKKYTRAKKELEFEVKLNYNEVSKARSENELIDIISEAFLKSQFEIEALHINNFDTKKFYGDLKKFLNDRSWLDLPYKESFFIYKAPQQNKFVFSDEEKMQENIFWDLIECARVESKGNFNKQYEITRDKLSKKSEDEIIGFECTLRELIKKAYHYNVMAAQKIIESNVSDDSFLYFRCKLILYGRITFENAINNPNCIVEYIDSKISGEPLLTVADEAFRMKFGEENTRVLPESMHRR
jgi:hypothetical protein